jgi:AMP deaminase
LLLTIRGFDTVDDESEYEALDINDLLKTPVEWNTKQQPPYVYYLYYLYANITSLNIIRKNLGLNTYQFRPHCGESGQVDHLVAAFMLCDGISHGI